MGHHKRRRSSSAETENSADIRRRQLSKQQHRHNLYRKNRSASSISISKPSTEWENIVLHNLCKLKNWCLGQQNSDVHHPQSGMRESSVARFRRANEMKMIKDRRAAEPEPGKYYARSPPLGERRRRFDGNHPYDDIVKRKARNIVANAIEYGLANGVVEQKGNYFWLKEVMKPGQHRMQEEPDQLRRRPISARKIRDSLSRELPDRSHDSSEDVSNGQRKRRLKKIVNRPRCNNRGPKRRVGLSKGKPRGVSKMMRMSKKMNKNMRSYKSKSLLSKLKMLDVNR